MHKKIKKRLCSILILLASIAVGLTIVLWNINDNIIFFLTPSQMDKIMSAKGQIRIGGLVAPNSHEQFEDKHLFILSDKHAQISVEYKGILPILFRAEQGIVAQGVFDQSRNIFIATNLLAKHDENYRPPTS